MTSIRDAASRGVALTFSTSDTCKVTVHSSDPDEAVFMAQIIWLNTNLENNVENVLGAMEHYVSFFSGVEQWHPAIRDSLSRMHQQLETAA